MRIVCFYHSLVSDWNHGNAHFLRGVVRELGRAGHEVRVWEPADGWSRANMIADGGQAALAAFAAAFPGQRSELYGPDLDLDRALDGADMVLVHEWTDPALVARIGRHRAAGGRYRLYFHDTHHRSATAPEEIDRFDLDGYDGILVFGAVIREIYLERGWARRVWVWHEAADTALFAPVDGVRPEGHLVWIGNWGDDERTAELHEYLLDPIKALGLRALIHGVRYPAEALEAVARSGARHGGWLPNHLAPGLFAAHRVTVHVPRAAYRTALPGIPTIRMFEALACGIPLVSAPWTDAEGLFRPGRDFLFARDGAAMKISLRGLLADPAMAAEIARSGLETIRARHTCAHRVQELLAIHQSLEADIAPAIAEVA